MGNKVEMKECGGIRVPEIFALFGSRSLPRLSWVPLVARSFTQPRGKLLLEDGTIHQGSTPWRAWILKLFWGVINFIIMFFKCLFNPELHKKGSRYTTDYRPNGRGASMTSEALTSVSFHLSALMFPPELSFTGNDSKLLSSATLFKKNCPPPPPRRRLGGFGTGGQGNLAGCGGGPMAGG
uniref:Uncharacterized protein n=1 Tax=Timema poppense TaxID=170557 RepID=A0A7R9D428_TIMPO|nr:unnamed protein product [Timema poppensis]